MAPPAFHRNELGAASGLLEAAYELLLGCSRLLKALEGFQRLLKAVNFLLISGSWFLEKVQGAGRCCVL